jgi:hypothetical protein
MPLCLSHEQPGDVAAQAGVKLAEAEEALQALTYDTEGALEVR